MKLHAAVAVLVLSLAAPAYAQSLAGATPDMVLDHATACAAGPGIAGIANKAQVRGWAELNRRDAVRLQVTSNDKAEVRAWSTPDMGGGPAYLLVEAPVAGRPRPFACEVVFTGVDGRAVAAAMQGWDFGAGALGAPTLSGPWGQGGAFSEFRAPDASGWRLVGLTVEPPPRRGAQRSRIRFSGVEN